MEQSKPHGWKRGFFTIAAGQTVSLIGSSAVQFALIWWLASESSSPMTMALAGLFAFLPQLVLGPFVGVWVDRLKRKTVIISADLFMGLVATVFAGVFLLGRPPFWSACLVLGIRAVGNVFHTPAIQAAIPMLVPRDQLVRANGWSQFMQSGAFMLGPVLGAAMYAALPLPVILLSDLAGAVAASVTVAVVKIPDPPRAGQELPHFLREMRDGAAVFLRDRRLFTLTLCVCVGMIFYMPLSSFYPLMTSDHFQATAWHASLVELLYAAGMMLSAAGLGAVGTIKNKFSVIHLGLLGLAASTLLCGILPSDMVFFWPFAVFCAVMGASGNLYGIPFMAYMQESVPHEAQGRVFSLLGSMMSLAMPLGLLIAGPVAERFGVPLWFFLSGIVLFAVTGVSALLTLRPRGRDPQ